MYSQGLLLTLAVDFINLGASEDREDLVLPCPCSELISGEEFICMCSSLKALLHDENRSVQASLVRAILFRWVATHHLLISSHGNWVLSICT